MLLHPARSLRRPHQLYSQPHHQPIWKQPWKRPRKCCRTSCRSPHRRTESAGPDAGWKTAPSTSWPGNCRHGSRARTARLTGSGGNESNPPEAVVEPPAEPETPEEIAEPPNWLTRAPNQPPRGEARRDRLLLDLLPVGVLNLSARTAALCQPGISGSAGAIRAGMSWSRPLQSTRSNGSNPASPALAAHRTPARR